MNIKSWLKSVLLLGNNSWKLFGNLIQYCNFSTIFVDSRPSPFRRHRCKLSALLCSVSCSPTKNHHKQNVEEELIFQNCTLNCTQEGGKPTDHNRTTPAPLGFKKGFICPVQKLEAASGLAQWLFFFSWGKLGKLHTFSTAVNVNEDNSPLVKAVILLWGGNLVPLFFLLLLVLVEKMQQDKSALRLFVCGWKNGSSQTEFRKCTFSLPHTFEMIKGSWEGLDKSWEF